MPPPNPRDRHHRPRSRPQMISFAFLHRLRRPWRVAHLSDLCATPAFAIPVSVLATTGILFVINAALLRQGILPVAGYDLAFAGVCLLPPALGHILVNRIGQRTPGWWLLWLPGILLFWTRPWYGVEGWDLLWMRPAYIWEHTRALFWAAFYDRTPPAHAIATVLSVGCVLTATTAMLVRPWLGGRADGAAGDTSPKGAGTVEGLPQARWADSREMSEHFHHPGGIVLGELTDPIDHTPGFDPNNRSTWKRQGKGRLITMDPTRGNGHVVVITASAGGKTAGIVIPNILHYDGPLVVVDPKGDLYARTKHTREAMGFKARVINAENGFDPFKLVAPLAPTTPSIYLTMAKTLMPLSARSSDISEYFHDMSCSLFAALMADCIERRSDNVAREISTFISRSRSEVVEFAQEMSKNSTLDLIRDELAGLAALDERTYPGVVKGIANKLAFARFPDIACYGTSKRTPKEHLAVFDPKTDIFINLPALAAKDFSSFLRLLIGAMYVTTELLEQPDRPEARRLFLIDEARVLGGMDALTHVRDAGRSIGLHLMLIYQSLGQLKDAWGGDAGADAWLDSCEARVVGAVGSARTAQDLVTMLGRRTVRTRTRGSSSSSPVMAALGGSVSSSAQEQLREVPLMSAAALGQLPPHGSVIFTRRTRPILATKALYFTRPDMSRKVKSPEEVTHELDVTKRRERVMEALDENPKSESAAPPDDPAPVSTKPDDDATRSKIEPSPDPDCPDRPDKTLSTIPVSDEPHATDPNDVQTPRRNRVTTPIDINEDRVADPASGPSASGESGLRTSDTDFPTVPFVPDPARIAMMRIMADQHPEIFDLAHKFPEVFRMAYENPLIFDAVVTERSARVRPQMGCNELPPDENDRVPSRSQSLRPEASMESPPSESMGNGVSKPVQEDARLVECRRNAATTDHQPPDANPPNPSSPDDGPDADTYDTSDTTSVPTTARTTYDTDSVESREEHGNQRAEPGRETHRNPSDPTPQETAETAASAHPATPTDPLHEPEDTHQPDASATPKTKRSDDGAAADSAPAQDATDPSGITHGDSTASRPDIDPTRPSSIPSQTTKIPRAQAVKIPPLKAKDIRIRLQMRGDDLFEQVFGPPRNRARKEWRAAADDAITFTRTGANQGQWYHHKLGIGGDLFDLVAIARCGRPIEHESRPGDFPKILRAAAEYVGYNPATTPPPSPAELRALEAQRAEQDQQRQRDRQDKLTLIDTLQALARPIEDTPAARYLAARGIDAWPSTGLAYLPPLIKHLPETQRQTLRGVRFGALTIWAEDVDGTVIGGQRILLTSDGTKTSLKSAKPNVGFIAGTAGKFRPPIETADDPLVIAEGPESALSIWFATGLETWTVFGVSGFHSLSLPPGRTIILAPDQDPPDSPAAKTFQRAATQHLENGHDLWIARAPESEGSKKDLNDTLRERGITAVQDAISAAQPFKEAGNEDAETTGHPA